MGAVFKHISGHYPPPEKPEQPVLLRAAGGGRRSCTPKSHRGEQFTIFSFINEVGKCCQSFGITMLDFIGNQVVKEVMKITVLLGRQQARVTG